MIYERIRNLREDRDITQAEIGNYLNVSQRTYSRYETGERSIPIEVFIQLSNYYHVSVDYLVGLTDQKRIYPRKKK